VGEKEIFISLVKLGEGVILKKKEKGKRGGGG